MATEKVSTIKSSGGHYTTLTAWEADLGSAGGVTGADLVTNDEIAVAELYNDLSDKAFTNGWTTDSTRYVHIRPASGLGHGGSTSSGILITPSAASSGPLLIYITAKVSDLRFTDTLDIGTDGFIRHASLLGAGEELTIERCIFQPTNGNRLALNVKTGTSTGVKVINCLIYGMTRGVSALSTSDAEILNCTIVDCGDRGHLRTVVKNTFFYGHTASDYFSPSTGSTNYASSDTTGSAGLQSLTSAEFNNYAGGDYSLAETSNLIDAGVDLSGTFTDDIAGNTRS